MVYRVAPDAAVLRRRESEPQVLEIKSPLGEMQQLMLEPVPMLWSFE